MANEKAELLKPQEWERFDKWKVVPGGEADDWGVALEGTPFPFMDIAQMVDESDAREIVAAHNAAHAPSGSPPALEPFGKNFYDSGTVWQAGSVASQGAPSGSPLADMIRRLLYAHPDKLLKKEAEALLHKHYYDTRSAADQELSEGIAKLGEEAIGSVASQEAAQPIPSIADVSDHNPNDPSCKACGSAMGWKCLSCGSTPEPTQKAAQPTTGFPIDKTDDWEERQDRSRQPDYKGSGNWAEHQKREAGTPAKE